MAVEYTVISIGTLSRNRLWGESAGVRTAHATTTLVVDESRRILVDPSLPGRILSSRYNERTGGVLADVTDVFCTTLRPVHRRSIEALPDAIWWCSRHELETYRQHLTRLESSADRLSAEDAAGIRRDLELLGRFRPAPDRFTGQVQLYPLAGPSPGSAGLVLTPPVSTIAIAGDAVVTAQHLQCGQVWEGCADVETAMDSLTELLELADVIVPGHDNVTLCGRRWL